MAPIENQLTEILLALENGKVTDEMLHSVGLSSVGELQAAVRNRSQEMLKTLRKKKRNRIIELVNKIAALQEGRIDGIDASFLMAIIKENPSLQVLVCEAFKANSFQLLNDIRAHDELELDKAVRGRQLHLYLENLPRIMANSKNQDLISQLAEKRDSMCGIGTRRLKFFLNKLMKNGDIIAQSYRLALELQDINIVAKRQYGGYRDHTYEKKRNLLKELIGLCREQGWVYGYQSSSVIGVDSVIYFELPYMEQIVVYSSTKVGKIEVFTTPCCSCYCL